MLRQHSADLAFRRAAPVEVSDMSREMLQAYLWNMTATHAALISRLVALGDASLVSRALQKIANTYLTVSESLEPTISRPADDDS